MATSTENWFVEQFDLRSPIEEFEQYCQSALHHLREGASRRDTATHREAIALVLGKLRPERPEPTLSASSPDSLDGDL